MNQNILLAMPSGPELFIVLAIVLIIFGGSKIPKLMGGFGKGIKEFKKGIADESDTPKEPVVAVNEAEAKKQLKEKSE